MSPKPLVASLGLRRETMRVRCPKCDDVFQAKANARRIKCPGCGFREEAPAEGFGAAWASGKMRKDTFRPDEPVRSGGTQGGSGLEPMKVAAVVLLVAALAVAGWWFFLRDDGAAPADRYVMFDTAVGSFTLELETEKAPKTAANFLTYVSDGFYDNLVFHRVVQGPIYVIQGGGQRADGTEPATRDPIQNEATSSGLKNEAYTISMARTAEPHSATSQFFINTRANPSLDPGGVSPDGYAVFGKVVAGKEVVDAIQNAPVNGERPVDPVLIRSARIVASPTGGSTTGAPTSSSTTSAPADANCASAPNAQRVAPSAIELDLITPGVWNVCSDTETMYVWLHNNGTAAFDYTWSITGAGGAPLPAGWSVTFATPSGTLTPGWKQTGAWAATVVTLSIPSTEVAADVAAELHAAGATRPFTFHVQDERGRVATSGEFVQTHYDLRYSSGTPIQDGPYCFAPGTGNAVKGYLFGTLGVAKGETVDLVVPPPFAYGFGGQFGDDTVTWTTTVMEFVSACPRP